MGEPDRFAFSYKEIVECLIKKENIHEGIWGPYVQFGIGAANIPGSPEKDGEQKIVPAAVVPVLKIGIQRFKEENNLTVDAAKVNPPPKKTSKSKL